MFDRIKNLMSGMVNSGVNKMETPEVLLEQAEMEMQKSTKQLKEALIESVTNEKMLEKQLQKTAEEFSTWEKRAALAVSQNDDALATSCLQKKQELGQTGQSAQEQLQQQKATTANLKARSAEMDAKLKEFLRKKPDMLARIKAGDTLAKANELISGVAGADSSMDQWEAKIRAKEIEADPLGTGTIDAKFKELDKFTALDDELQALKAKMGKHEVDAPLLSVVEVKKEDNDGGTK